MNAPCKERCPRELSARELDVLDCILDGLDNLEIAKRLCISSTTVKTHISNLYRKTQQNSRVRLVLWALGQSEEHD